MLKINLQKLIWEFEFWKKLSGFLPRHSLITLYKSFTQPHLDYADIYDQPNNLDLCNKIGTCQYNAALAITSAIRGSSKDKIVRNKSPGYLCKYILPGDRAYLTRNSNNSKQIFFRSQYFASSFFPIRLRSGIS